MRGIRGNFGKRTGLRCYVRLVSLLESGVSMGGREMRRHLETEMENAFSQRKDLAMRKGEEAATKLLLPMFFHAGSCNGDGRRAGVPYAGVIHAQE